MTTSVGDVHDPFNIASIRKPLLGSLFGIADEEGAIHLEATLEAMDVDDRPPLTIQERQATVRHLLQMRTGISHAANYESESAAGNPDPDRRPDGAWRYSNWDANALGTIYQRLVGRDVFDDFRERIAIPLEMKDFDTARCEHREPDTASVHRAYVMRMSAADLARFGMLYCRLGVWNGKPVVPKRWITESTTPYSLTSDGHGFGYMWDIFLSNSGAPSASPRGYGFSGFPGHLLFIAPNREMVMVYEHRIGGHRPTLSTREIDDLVDRALTDRAVRSRG